MHADVLTVILTTALLGFLLVAAVFDLVSGFLPDVCTAAIAALTILLSLLSGTLLSSFFGALFAYSCFRTQWLLSHGKAVGSGDIVLATALGLWLGFEGAFFMLFFAYALGAIVVSFLLACSIISLKQNKIPFAPFLALGAVLSYSGIAQNFFAF